MGIQPLLHFTIVVLDKEPVDKTPDDFQIVVAEITDKGPDVHLFPYTRKATATFDHELLTQIVLRRLAMANKRTFAVGDKFHVRIRFNESPAEYTHLPSKVIERK
jgi:hypothetical protein